MDLFHQCLVSARESHFPPISQYRGRVSPIFKRNRKNSTGDKLAPSFGKQHGSPDSLRDVESSSKDTKPQGSTHDTEGKTDDGKTGPSPSRSHADDEALRKRAVFHAQKDEAPTRMEKISRTYASWHTELSDVAAQAENSTHPHNPAIVDLTHPHPTGASQLYSGRPTLLSSLIREETAQKYARRRLETLRGRIESLSEQYGYAPVTLAVGQLSWTELPENREESDLGAVYASTGELRLDADSVEMQALTEHNTASLPAIENSQSPSSEKEHVANDASDDDSADKKTLTTKAAIAEERVIDSADTNRTQSNSVKTLAASKNIPAANETAIREIHEPALLRTARLDPAGPGDAYITLTARSEINPAVLKALRMNGIRAEEISKLRAVAADVTREDEALARLRELGRAYLPGFLYEDAALLGSFVHPGRVLLNDLEAMKPYIETSGIMAAIAGDEETRRLSSAPLPPAETRDRAPEAERGAGDRDPAELAVVEAVASGRSIVVDTPPGADAIGTLAAIVSDAAASGRSVIYVPGRASTVRALVDEMDRLGLGDVVLDFSDLDSVARRLRTGLRQRIKESDPSEVLDLRTQLTSARQDLNSYISAVHDVDPRWKRSLHSLLEQLADLMSSPTPPKSRVRLGEESLELLLTKRDEVETRFADAAELGAFADAADSPWAGADIRQVEEGQKAIRRARRLAKETLPVVMAQSQRASGETGLSPAETFEDWCEQIEVFTGISRSLDIFLPQIFERSAQSMVIATATKEWREKNSEEMKGAERRRLIKQAKDLLRPGATSADLHSDLATVQHQREVWKRYATESGWPTLPEGMAQIRATAEEAEAEIRLLDEVLPGVELTKIPLGELLERLRLLAADEETMGRLPKANEIIDGLRAEGFGSVVDDFLGRGIEPLSIGSELDLVTASSIFEHLVAKTPALATTTPAALSALAQQVRDLDKRHCATLAAPVLRAVVRIMRDTIAKRRDDVMKLDAQLERYSTGVLRDAIATYPRLVQVARPVWVIPSMMTAEFVPPMPWADVVIMDEQDGVALASSVSMLMRGRQIVVMGDVRRSREGDEKSAVAQLAEVLPVCELPTLRAQHDELATEVLREQGYDDVLRMVPVAKRARKPRLILVDGRGVPNRTTGAIESTQAEVDAVVDAVVEHALSRPEKSLVVVAVSSTHAMRIREALKKLAEGSSELTSFFSRLGSEPFAVVELGQTGGLRRDCVIVTVGFGKTVHGRVLHSFGELASTAGLKGLVDAVEAPREELTIISCLGPGEIEAGRISSPGPRLLATLIDRAGGKEVGLEPSVGDADVGPLLTDLAHRVRRAGFRVATDYGYPDGVRIPLVAGDASLPGVWRVAVVTDDAEYVAEPSLRRRDRYWIERLERRGWRVIRVFSPSVFIDPQGQAEAVVKALLEARAQESERVVEVPVLEGEWDSSASVRRADPQEDEGISPVSSVNGGRSERPPVRPGLPLAAYTDDQLDELVVWIGSDGVERSRPEFVEELRRELAIDRRGVQVDSILANVVDRSGLAVSLNLSAPAEDGPPTLANVEVVRDAEGQSFTSGDAERHDGSVVNNEMDLDEMDRSENADDEVL